MLSPPDYNIRRIFMGGNDVKNVLLNVYEFDAPWAVDTLKTVLKPGMKATVLTMTHGDEIPNGEVWNQWYTPGGKVFELLGSVFASYGIDTPEYVSLFHDTAASAGEKIRNADVLFVTGGLPDLFYERLVAMGLLDTVKNFDGVFMGCSAGAMVQMQEYHITPDEDYDHYGYYPGLGFLDGFEPEVHFANTPVQHESIERYLRERGKPVYAMTNQGGLLGDGEEIIPFGEVTLFPGV